MNELNKIKDFIFENLGLTCNEKKDKNDTIISKTFTRKGKEYGIVARFDKNGEYCYGYLVNANGTAIVNGRGFDFESFLNFINAEIKTL